MISRRSRDPGPPPPLQLGAVHRQQAPRLRGAPPRRPSPTPPRTSAACPRHRQGGAAGGARLAHQRPELPPVRRVERTHQSLRLVVHLAPCGSHDARDPMLTCPRYAATSARNFSSSCVRVTGTQAVVARLVYVSISGR